MTNEDINLHLLQCLEALVTERHVTRAAERMAMSQSGMSTALAKLRRVFNDQILVRTSRGMALSERAPEIAGAARRARQEIERALEGPGRFDIAEARTDFRVMASDYVGRMLLPRVIQTCVEAAPGITLTIVPPQPSRLREALANSEVDLVVGFFHDISEGLYQTSVVEEPLVGMVRAAHPRIGHTVSLAEYGAEEHIFFGSPPTFISSIEIVIETTIKPLGIVRQVRTHVPSLAMVPQIIAHTDMMATLPERLAHSFAAHYPLRVISLPFDAGALKVRAIWHERMHANNGHRWLRQTFQDVGRSLLREPLPSTAA